MGCASRRGLCRSDAEELGCRARAMGCKSAAEPLRRDVLASDDRARLERLGGRTHDRRGRGARTRRECRGKDRFLQEPGVLTGGIQGPAADVARLESAAAAADFAHRRTRRRLRVAAGGLPASGLRPRYPRLRPARNQVQAEMSMIAALRFLFGFALPFVWCVPANAYLAYISNEKSNTVSVIDTNTWQVTRTIKVGQRPRGIAVTRDQRYVLVAASDDDTIQMIDRATHRVAGKLPSGPDPEAFVQDPEGRLIYVSNENDNTVTVIDIAKRARLADIPVGVEPEGITVSPDGKIVVNTSESTNMAHFIDTASREIVANVLVDARPRHAEFKPDGSALWVSSEI